MKRTTLFTRGMGMVLCAALVGALIVPASAFFWNRKEEPKLLDVTKNGLFGSEIVFEAEDFRLKDAGDRTLEAIIIDTLPDPKAGVLLMGEEPVAEGTQVAYRALPGLRFRSNGNTQIGEVEFEVTPVFSDGTKGDDAEVTIYLLTKENQGPIARNMDLSTYKNVSITGYFDAVDSEGEPLTFQLTSNPARGAVQMAEDGSSQFVYTPYENKTGKDAFTYVAVDPAGNVSPEAEVTVVIEKANTTVTYADMEGHEAHKAAIRLAQEGVYMGARVNGRYFFEPDRPVSRVQFLSMAMDVVGLEPMEDVTQTGFYDDVSIPTWAKGNVCAALKAGIVQGGKDEHGAPVFKAQETVTMAEAAVMLDQMLNLADVPAEVFSVSGEEHWATQSAANLAASGMLRTEQTGTVQLVQPMTMGEAAQLLDRAISVLDARG